MPRLNVVLVFEHDPQVAPDTVIVMTGTEGQAWRNPVTQSYDRNLGITSLAKSSIERNTPECSMLPSDTAPLTGTG